MGEPITRLNPKVESQISKILFNKAIILLISIAMLFPEERSKKRGPKPYDYRIIMVLCILRVLLRKTYLDYEIEMRSDQRIFGKLGLEILPGKSTIQRGMSIFTMNIIREFNRLVIQKWINRKLNILVDASGIRVIGSSIWYCLRIKRTISKRDCDKVHLAICSDTLLILNWFITEGKKHDSPFFVRLLAPFRFLGVVLADAGYLARKNYQFVADRKGSAFIPFKSNSTAKKKSCPAWTFAFNLWKAVPMVFKSIYHQRSKIEGIFFALKKRYGDHLDSKGTYRRRREFALRLIAYNVRLVIALNYAKEHNLSCWVRAKN